MIVVLKLWKRDIFEKNFRLKILISCFEINRQILAWKQKNTQKIYRNTGGTQGGDNINLLIIFFTKRILLTIRPSIISIIHFHWMIILSFNSLYVVLTKYQNHMHDFYAIFDENSFQLSNLKKSRKLEFSKYRIRSCGSNIICLFT